MTVHARAAALVPREALVEARDPTLDILTLAIENMRCGGCLRSVERAALAIPGVMSARANLSAKRVSIAYDPLRASEVELITALGRAGFPAAAMHAVKPEAELTRQKFLLRRVAVAGFAAMNIMLLSISVWAGAAGDMDPSLAALFRWLSALIALPTVAYAGQPFFASALGALRARRLNMDVPISLAILLATAMSLYQTFRGSEQVYFDAAVSLLFFLLIGRFLDQVLARPRPRRGAKPCELAERHRHGHRGGRLPTPGARACAAARRSPARGRGRASGGRWRARRRIGRGRSELDHRRDATRDGDGWAARLFRHAQPDAADRGRGHRRRQRHPARRDRQAHACGRAGQGALSPSRRPRGTIYAPAVHGLGLATFLGWLVLGASWQTALTYAIAVLIITCPCALALAVPAVQIAAASRLFRQGIVVKAADGLERVAETDMVVFDKTGTLTLGRPTPGSGANPRYRPGRGCVARHGEHASLRACDRRRGDGSARRRSGADGCRGDARVRAQALPRPRRGATGLGPVVRDRKQRRSKRGLVLPQWGCSGLLPLRRCAAQRRGRDRSGAEAELAAGPPVRRPQGRSRSRRRRRRHCDLESGACAGREDRMAGEGRAGRPQGADGGRRPQRRPGARRRARLDFACERRRHQPTHRDFVFQGEKLVPVVEIIATARRARRMALQNFGVAFAYNIVSVPFAMAGYVTPLIAAIVMSTSSILVTLNATRLSWGRRA